MEKTERPSPQQSQNAGKSAALTLTVHGEPFLGFQGGHTMILMWSVGSQSALDAVERSGAVCGVRGWQAAAVTPVRLVEPCWKRLQFISWPTGGSRRKRMALSSSMGEI